MTHRVQDSPIVDLEPLPSVDSAMSEPPCRPQDPLSPQQGAAGDDVVPSVCTDKKFSQAVDPSPTKYDVLPPGFPRPSAPPDSHHPLSAAHGPPSLTTASTPPSDIAPIIPAVTTAETAPSLMTPKAAPVTTGPGGTNCAALLANVRAKLAAAKKREITPIPSLAATTITTSSSIPPTQSSDVQVFELTHLKTIKCDVCERKNGAVLYKCRNCPFHHQICSRCVETTEPKPAEGEVGGRRDWSVHSRLKDAHAAYNQPVCPGRDEDGTYRRNGVEFVLAQGKRGGVRTARRTTTAAAAAAVRTEVNSLERNSALGRAVAGHRSIEQARRIAQMAGSGPRKSPSRSRSRSREMSDAVAAAPAPTARARQAGFKAGPGTTQLRLGNKKRKATVLGEGRVDGGGDGHGHGDGNVADDEDGDDEDEGPDVVDRDEEDGRDDPESATALENSVLENGRRRGRQSRGSGSHSKHKSEPPLAPLWLPSRVLPRFRAVDAAPRHASCAPYFPLSIRPHQASISDLAARQDVSYKSNRRPSSGPSLLGSAQTGRPTQDCPHIPVMRITSPNTRPSGDPNPRSFLGLLGQQRSRDPDTTSPATTSIFDFVDQGDRHRGTALTSRLDARGPRPSHPVRLTGDEETKEKYTSFQAQGELQHTAGGDRNEGAGPYAKEDDAEGIAIPFQAAKVSGDGNRPQQLHNRKAQLDGSVTEDEPGISDQPSDDDGDGDGDSHEGSNNPSEPDWPSSDRTTLQGVTRPTESSEPNLPTIPEPGPLKFRRSERLATLHPDNRPQNQRRTAQRARIRTKPSHHAAAVTSREENGPSAAVLSRINATTEKPAAGAGAAVVAPRQRSKPKWHPLVTSFLAEQRRKRRKTMEWLAQQPSGEDDDGYDKGVEGGVWIQSEGESEISRSEGEDANEVDHGAHTNKGRG